MSDVKNLAYQDYLAGMKYKDIAEKHGVSLSTIKSWAIRDWKKVAEKKLQPDAEKVATKNKKLQPKKEEKRVNEIIINSVEENEELTEKERLFCICYVKNFNATQAAINAGYSENCPSEIGYQLLQKTSVRNEINKLKAIRANSIMLSADDIVERLMRIAFGDMNDFATWGMEWQPVIGQFGPIMIKDVEGNPTPLMQEVNTVRFKESTMVDGSLVSQIKQGKDGMSIKLHDQKWAMDKLDKYFLMNPLDKHKIDYDNARLAFDKKKVEDGLDDGKPIELILKKVTKDKG